MKISPFKNTTNYFVRFFLMLCTLTFISFTRIFFRSSSTKIVETIFERISMHPGWELVSGVFHAYRFVLIIMAAGYVIHWIPERIKMKYRSFFANLHPVFMILIGAMLVVLMYQLMSGDMQPFIYFQF